MSKVCSFSWDHQVCEVTVCSRPSSPHKPPERRAEGRGGGRWKRREDGKGSGERREVWGEGGGLFRKGRGSGVCVYDDTVVSFSPRSLSYEKSQTLFRVGRPPFNPVIRNISLSNQFDIPVVLYDVRLSSRAQEYFSVRLFIEMSSLGYCKTVSLFCITMQPHFRNALTPGKCLSPFVALIIRYAVQ